MRGGQDFSHDDPLLHTLRKQEAHLSAMMSQFLAQLNFAASSDSSRPSRLPTTDLMWDDSYPTSVEPYPLLSPISSSLAGPNSPFY
jgi:hypothetical protein